MKNILATGEATELAIGLIDPSPLNPRSEVDADLAASLSAVGQLDPILVRPNPAAVGRYEIANGHRRWKGAKKAGLMMLAARVRDLTDAQMLDIMLGSGGEGNVKPLTALDEAAGLSTALKVMGLSHRALADHFGKSVAHVQRRLALLDLPEDARTAVAKGTLPPTTAWLIARIPDSAKRIEASTAILHSAAHEGVMPFAAAKIYIEHNVCRALAGAPFDIKDAELVKEAGACTACPFNSSKNRETYDDAPNHRCMSPTCFEAKCAASRSRLVEREEKAGKKALTPEANAKIFPKGDTGLAWSSGYVELAKPPPADLLKKEVVNVPAWKDLCSGKASVQVYVGFDQSGRAVDLVKIEEALLAADENDRAVFSPEIIKRYNLDRGAASLKRDRERSLVKPATKDKKSTDGDRGPIDSRAGVQLPAAPASVEETWEQRAVLWIQQALDAAPTLPPAIRSDGFQLLREVGASTITQHASAPVSSSESKRLAEWQKMHGQGMSPQKIAATDKVALEDVCGALELDVHVARNQFSQLRQSAEEAFAQHGIKSAAVRDRLSKTAAGCGFEEIATPEELHRLLAFLSRSKTEPPLAQPKEEN